MKVSNANNKVKLASLREWNKLTNDNIKSGSRLIVGFLVAPEAGVASTASTPVAQSNTQEVKKDEPVAAAEKPVAKTEEANRTMPETKALVVADKEDQKKPDSNPVKSVSNDPAGADRTDQVATTGQGYFKPYFDQQIRDNPATRNETVTSGIFKTAYGLQEAKYYLLMDKVQPGTIIRIMNPDNNRAVFAKVLGEMSGIRQNKGLDIRISESAATSLGIGDPEKFIVKINY
jgi:LysM repeat protein